MDFFCLKRKQLQALCKKHGLPANRTNLEMAETLTAHFQGNDNPASNEKDPDDIPKKFKKVRFNPENETREYEPSVYRMRSRRRTTSSNADSNSSKQRNVSDKVVGTKRGRGNEKLESVSRITRAQAKVDKKTSSLIEKETEAIRSRDGCEKVLEIQEPLKGSRRNAAREKSTASQKEEVSKIIDRDSVEARKGCRRSKRNAGKCIDSELVEVEVVGKVTRSKAQSAGNVSAIEREDEVAGVVKECRRAISETNEVRRSTRNSSRLSLIATSNEMEEIGDRDGKVGPPKRKHGVVQEIVSSTEVDESLVEKPSRRLTRHNLTSDFMGPSVPYKSVEKKQKILSRVSIMTEETTLTNISPPSEGARVTTPEAAGQKNYSSPNNGNAVKSNEKTGELKSQSGGKSSNASVDVSALHSGIGEEIDSITNLKETGAATPVQLSIFPEQEESTIAGLSVVANEKNILPVDDTRKLVSDGCNESGKDYQSLQSFEICTNLDCHDSAEFKSIEFQAKACDVVPLVGGPSCANQSAFPDECPNLYELEKGTVREEMSTGKDASYGSDCINDHSTEFERISTQENGVCGIKSTKPDNTKQVMEHEVLTDNGKISPAVTAEIFTKSTAGVGLESDGVNDGSTAVEDISVQEDGFNSLERTEQDNTTDKNEKKLVPQNRKASPDVWAEPAVEDTKDIHHESDDEIEHSTQRKRKFIEHDGVSGLESTKEENTAYELRKEAVSHIGKGSLHEDVNNFSLSENIVIKFSKGKDCNATKLHRLSFADECQDANDICQFAPEEKDCNGGQICSAAAIALKSLHTGCTTAKDNDENQQVLFQAFGTGLSFSGVDFSEESRKSHDEKIMTDSSNCGDEKNALSQIYLEELEDGKVIANNSNHEVFCQQDFGDCMAGKKDISFDSNDGQPLCMESLSEPSNQELCSQTTGQESEFSAGKDAESMAQFSKHISRIDRMEVKEKSFEGSDSQSQVDTFEKFVGDPLDEEAALEVRDENLLDGICENSEVVDKETCMMTMDMQVEQNGVALQSNCTEEPGKSNIVIVDDKTCNRALDPAIQLGLEGNAVELSNLKEKSVLESDTIDFADLDMDVKAANANETVGKRDTNFKCKNANSDSDREFEKMAFPSHENEAFELNLAFGEGEEFEIEKPSKHALQDDVISEDAEDLLGNEKITEQVATQVSEDHNGECTDVSIHGNSARDHLGVAEEEVNVQQGSVKEETLLNEIDCLTLNRISCENENMIPSTEGGEAHCLHKVDDEILTMVESKKAADFEKLDFISPFKSEVVVNCKTISAVCASPSHESEALELNLSLGEGEGFEVEKPSELALQVDLTSKHAGELPENARITEQAATQVSEDDIGECADVSSHGNNARVHHKSAEEEVKVQQSSVKEETLLNEKDCLTLNKIFCENKVMIHSTEGGEAHCLLKYDDEILTIFESKKAADFEKPDGISPFESEAVVDCKTISAVCASPSHESEALELNLFFGEGEDPECRMDEELQKNVMISEQAATQDSEDHNGEFGHQMDKKLPKNITITEEAATQASEDKNGECMHLMDEKLPNNVTIVESAATQVVEDQHDEHENQMEEVAKLKRPHLAVSDEPDLDPVEESKMQDNELAKVDDDIQVSIVYVLQENELVKVEAKAFHDAPARFEKALGCKPSNLKQDNISNLAPENVEEAAELIENAPKTGATTADESLMFSSSLSKEFTAADGQSCQGKLHAPKKTSSCPEKEEEFKLNGEQLVCSVMKLKSNITGLIQETPHKDVNSYLMKENPPSMKREQIGNIITVPKSLQKRRALEDLRNN